MAKQRVNWGVIVALVGAAAACVAAIRRARSQALNDLHERAHRFIASRVQLACSILKTPVLPLRVDVSIENAAYAAGTIMYNPAWVLRTLQEHCGDGRCEDSVVLGVVAHEIGHHLYQSRFCQSPDAHAQELFADEIAGRVLAATGRGMTDFETVIRSGSPAATPTHPDGRLRAVAIRRGYEAIAARRLGYAT